MVTVVESATAVLVIAGGLAGIFGITFLSIFKINKKSSILAIIVSTILSCIFMVPVISAFNNLIDLKVEGSIIDAGKAEIKAQRAEVERLKAENRVRMLEREKLDNQITMAKQSIEIEALNDNIKLLENAQLSMQSFQKILELALLQTNLKQTLVKKEPITEMEKGWGLRAEYLNDEMLAIITHDITAKFGVDLNEVKIAKIDGNTAVVSGIRSKFIGTSKNVTNTLLKEIRRNNYKRGVLVSVDTRYTSDALNLADKYAAAYETEFQTKLSEGLELGFMDEAVIQLAQNFIKVMFAPLYKNIRFDEAQLPDALPLMEYLQKELKDNQDRKIELWNSNENLVSVIEQIAIETVKVAEEQDLSDSEA
jgi:hypothetical protein